MKTRMNPTLRKPRRVGRPALWNPTFRTGCARVEKPDNLRTRVVQDVHRFDCDLVWLEKQVPMSFLKNKWFAFASSAFVLFGTVALFFAFQTTSSDFRFVTAKNGMRSLCVDNCTMLMAMPNGGWSVGSDRCYEWDTGNPAAIVKVENPRGVWVGFGLVVLGSLMQLFTSFAGTRTEAELRADLRAIKKLSK